MIQAVIMAGGKGTRLLPVTNDKIPKPMAHVAGKPILQWQVEFLRNEGIVDILIVIGHLGEKIREFFGDGSRLGIHISYYHETQPLGTAGALERLENQLAENFFLILGDIIFNIDISRMMLFHCQKHAIATLFVHPNTHPYDSDLIIKDSESRIVGFLHKNEIRKGWYDNCVNAGFYILNRDICKHVPADEKVDLEKDIFGPIVNKKGDIYAYSSPEYIKDVGTLDRITAAEEELIRGIVNQRSLKRLQKCVFLDRDGTLNCHRGLISKPEQIELERTVIEAIKKINQSGWLAIVITNQPVIARGLCNICDVEQIHNKLKTLLGEHGAFLDDMLFCPHHPDKGYPEENPSYKIKCGCRKPSTGLIDKCVMQYHIDINTSWIVGDTTVDIQTGINAGLHTALVTTGEKGMDKKYNVKPEYTGKNLLDVINHILCEENNDGLLP